MFYIQLARYRSLEKDVKYINYIKILFTLFKWKCWEIQKCSNSKKLTGLIGVEMCIFGADYSAICWQNLLRIGLLIHLHIFHIQLIFHLNKLAGFKAIKFFMLSL